METKQARVRGRFYTEAEPNTERIAARIPESMYLELIDASNGQIAQFIREAIANEINRRKISH